MTLQQFVDKYNGKLVDYDGAYGGQCVDLYRMYVKEVLGLAQTPLVVGAKDIWTNETKGFEKIANTPTGVPSVGDVMIWGAKYGPYGHVAIVTSADVNRFTCFSQNDPSGALCAYKNYATYGPTLGWLHPIPPVVDTHLEEIAKLQKQIDDLKTSQESLAKTVEELRLSIKEKDKTLESVTEELRLLKVEKQTWQEQIDYYKPYKARYENALTQLPNAMTGWQLIMAGIKKLKTK